MQYSTGPTEKKQKPRWSDEREREKAKECRQ